MATTNLANRNKSNDNFIYFSPLTKGVTGKAVKIHTDLFLPFFCSVDQKTYDGKIIINKIEALRSTPDHLTASPGNAYTSSDHARQLQNFRNNKERILIVKHAQIVYRIEQKNGDSAPTVYITQVRFINKGDNNAPGFYSRKKLPGSVQRGPATKMKTKKLSHLNVMVNGSADSLDEAMNRWGEIILFYSPASVSNDLGIWGTSSRSHLTEHAISELAEGIEFNKADVVKWKVEGEAGNLMTQALKRVKGTLPKHHFEIINPKADTPELLNAITQKEGVLPDNFISHRTEHSASSIIATASHKEALKQRIGLLPCDKVKRDHVISKIDEVTQSAVPITNQAASLGFKTKTFVQALQNAGVYRK